MKRKVMMLAAMAAVTVLNASNVNPDFRGKVVDSENAPMPYATVVVLTPDSMFVKGTVSDIDGLFDIPDDTREGILRISSIGFRTVCLNLPLEKSSDIKVTLMPESTELSEVEISATLPKTKLTGQGMETSIQGTVLETRGSAADVLENVPGMIKGRDGLEVIGKGTPVIYINGRLVRDKAELDRLQSNEIRSVEVINNPGAQYDATVTAVVRIHTVRHQGDGLSFNLAAEDAQSLRVGSFNDPSANASLNYRINGFDFFAGGSWFAYHNRQSATFIQKTLGTPGYVQDAVLRNDMDYQGWGVNGGMNWQINDGHSVGVRVEHSSNYRARTDQSMSEKFYKNGVLTDSLVTLGTDREKGTPSSTSVNAYYNGQVGMLSVDLNADWFASEAENSSHSTEKAMLGDAEINSHSRTTSDLVAYKLVLGYPVAGGMLQAGTEQTFARHSDRYKTDTYLSQSSSFVKEDNLGFFAEYGRALGQTAQMGLGLRYEHVGYDYDDRIGTSDTAFSYNNFFPSVSLAALLGPVQASLSYSTRTQRPGFANLSDAIRYNSRYVLQRGNSKLQNAISHELSLTARWNILTFVSQYTRTDHAMVQWSHKYNDDGVVLVDIQNLNNPVRTVSCYLIAQPTIGIWTLNYLAGVQNQWLNVDYEDRVLSFSGRPMWIAQAGNTFTLPMGFQASLDAEFHSKAYSQNMLITVNYFNLNASVQKTFLKDRSLVVRLDATDLTRTANQFIHADFGGHIHDQDNIMDTQRVTLSARYSFNAARSKYKGTGAGQETLQRMK